MISDRDIMHSFESGFDKITKKIGITIPSLLTMLREDNSQFYKLFWWVDMNSLALAFVLKVLVSDISQFSYKEKFLAYYLSLIVNKYIAFVRKQHVFDFLDFVVEGGISRFEELSDEEAWPQNLDFNNQEEVDNFIMKSSEKPIPTTDWIVQVKQHCFNCNSPMTKRNCDVSSFCTTECYRFYKNYPDERNTDTPIDSSVLCSGLF